MARKRDMDVWIWDVSSDLRRMNVEMIRSQVSISTRRYWQPKVDVFELSDSLLIVAEVAGVKLDDIALEYHGTDHSLKIRGSRPDQFCSEEPKLGIYQLEILYGHFERDVMLPRCKVIPEGITAQLGNGLLTVRIPKRVQDTYE